MQLMRFSILALWVTWSFSAFADVCAEDYTECKEDCSLQWGASVREDNKNKFIKCMKRCTKKMNNCSEREDETARNQLEFNALDKSPSSTDVDENGMPVRTTGASDGAKRKPSDDEPARRSYEGDDLRDGAPEQRAESVKARTPDRETEAPVPTKTKEKKAPPPPVEAPTVASDEKPAKEKKEERREEPRREDPRRDEKRDEPKAKPADETAAAPVIRIEMKPDAKRDEELRDDAPAPAPVAKDEEAPAPKKKKKEEPPPPPKKSESDDDLRNY